LIGVAFCGYLIFSPGSLPNSRTSITQTSQPTLLNTAIHSTLTTPEQVVFFDQIWTIVNDNYLYTDFNGLDWNAIRSEYIQKIEAGLSEDDFYQDMEELIDKLGLFRL
jgi:carboxyl-terminal processing protease